MSLNVYAYVGYETPASLRELRAGKASNQRTGKGGFCNAKSTISLVDYQ